jgi:hypothetical protein
LLHPPFSRQSGPASAAKRAPAVTRFRSCSIERLRQSSACRRRRRLMVCTGLWTGCADTPQVLCAAWGQDCGNGGHASLSGAPACGYLLHPLCERNNFPSRDRARSPEVIHIGNLTSNVTCQGRRRACMAGRISPKDQRATAALPMVRVCVRYRPGGPPHPAALAGPASQANPPGRPGWTGSAGPLTNWPTRRGPRTERGRTAGAGMARAGMARRRAMPGRMALHGTSPLGWPGCGKWWRNSTPSSPGG